MTECQLSCASLTGQSLEGVVSAVSQRASIVVVLLTGPNQLSPSRRTQGHRPVQPVTRCDTEISPSSGLLFIHTQADVQSSGHYTR